MTDRSSPSTLADGDSVYANDPLFPVIVEDIQRGRFIPEAYENESFLRRLGPGLIKELKTARFAVRSKPDTRFMIFAQGRTGSTLLTSTLDLHPRIDCRDEILNRPRVAPVRFVDHMSRSSSFPCFGFHVKIYQLTTWQRISRVELFLDLMHRSGWKIIYVWRENLLDHVVSNLFARASGRYHTSATGTSEKRRLSPDPDKVVRRMREREAVLEWERRVLAGVPYVSVNYEQDLLSEESQFRTFRMIQEILGVEECPLQPRLRKSVTTKMADLLANYDDVAAAIRAASYERFLPS